MTSFSSSFIFISRRSNRGGDGVKHTARTVLVVCLLTAIVAAGYQHTTRALQEEENPSEETSRNDTISFSRDVVPIIQKNCLPCHAEDNFNPSELSLDSYELLMRGGRHGDAVVPGKAGESPLVQKLRPDPPFGDRMPLDMRKKKGRKPGVMPLSEEEIELIATWIAQGARDN